MAAFARVRYVVLAIEQGGTVTTAETFGPFDDFPAAFGFAETGLHDSHGDRWVLPLYGKREGREPA